MQTTLHAPTSGRLLKHAVGRLNFTATNAEVPRAARLAACKTFLRLETAMMRMRHDAGESGVAVARARAATIDVMLAHLFDYAMATWKKAHPSPPEPKPPEVALVALGGYGRAELSPLSDIDIMFLYPSKTRLAALTTFQEHLVNEILYILWDCGLKVGHSSRTIDDAFSEARADVQTKTALLEARYIAGSETLFTNFASAYETFYRNEDPLAYIASRLKNQGIRRAKYGDTVFLQEPDIKNGVGGLRDYHSVLWLAHVKLGLHNIDDLVTEGYLRRNELRDFKRSYDFLMRVRNELHFNSKHPTDLLNLEQQPRIALGLGYTNQDMLGRVEQFMHDYYHAAQTIYRVAKMIEHRLSLTADPTAKFSAHASANGEGRFSLRDSLRLSRHQKTQRMDGFILRGNELVAENPQIFQEDPKRLIRVFRYAQQLSAQLDFALQALIRESLPLINRRVINSPDCAASFRAIMHSVGAVHPTLSLMHELGVLGRYIPEFDTLTCLVQHEYYHRYTADIHTLNAIRELDRIFLREETFTGKYLTALHETPIPSLLYLILLLHDIGKADGVKGHAENGAIMAGPVLERLRIDPIHRPIVTFIIKNHLIMARFWQRRDVDDPNTAIAFAEAIQNADNLRYLYVHTFCDSRSTSAELWNSYKDSLHTALYRATSERLIHDNAALALKNTERTQMKLKELLSEKIPGIAPDEITAHFNLLPERYFVQTDTTEISLHIRMVNQLLKSITTADSVGTLRPIIDWRTDLNRALTIVNVVTWDRAGLFYKLAGALSVAGVNILGAKIISRTDHIAIDTFYVAEPGGGIVQSQTAMETFSKNVEQALVANRDLYPDILAQSKKFAPRSTPLLGTTPGSLQSTFPPIIDVYHELSMQRTIVEIQARDHIGLLYQLAKTISDHGFDITFARIGTERGIAIDTFYIENANHEAKIDEARLHTLRIAIAQVVTPVAA